MPHDVEANGYFQIGTVVEEGEQDFPPDPAGLGWVCVALGHTSLEHYWMRLVQPYASKEFGFAFYPEVGDQVLTVRIADGEYLCLGSVYTKTTKAKISNDEGNKYGKNFIKEIRTKAGNAITINDEKDKEYVQVDVKEGEITLKMDIGGKIITLDGGSKTETVDIKATKAQMNVEVKNATVKVSGAVIDIQSDKIDVKGAKLTIKTDGAVDLNAGGKVTIKGTTVDIC